MRLDPPHLARHKVRIQTLAGTMGEVNLKQTRHGWPCAIAGVDGWGRAGLQVQQRGFPGQVA